MVYRLSELLTSQDDKLKSVENILNSDKIEQKHQQSPKISKQAKLRRLNAWQKSHGQFAFIFWKQS